MSYYLIDKETDYPYRKPGSISFASYRKANAMAVCTRFNKTPHRARYYVMLAAEWTEKFNPMVERKNLMSGKPVMVRKYEPLCTDPSSETYWSM